MSKLSDRMNETMDAFEELLLNRDTSTQTRTWAANWIKVHNSIEMLRNDAMRTNFPEEHELPQGLSPDAWDEMDKLAKTSFTDTLLLSEQRTRLEAYAAIWDGLEDPDITLEMGQRLANLLKRDKAGHTAQDATQRPKRANGDQADDLRKLDGWVKITHNRPDGTSKDYWRKGDFVGARWRIRELVNNEAAFAPIGTELTNMNEEVREAQKTRIPTERTFQDGQGNQFIVHFPAQKP